MYSRVKTQTAARAPQTKTFFLKSVKGHSFVKSLERVKDLGQILALVMVNECVNLEDSI